MSNIFWKNFYLCFSKFKCLSTTLPPPPPLLSSQQNHNHPSPPPSPTSTLIKNFNSLYDPTTTSSDNSTATSFSSLFSSASDSDTDSPPPDLATIFASQRFFFSSPGTSNSIIHSPDPPRESVTVVAGGVAVQTYSPDPYSDFRRSMQEMVQAHQLMDVEANWDYLHELLLCYLSLNPKHTHKFIVAAFSDLLISIMSSTDHHRKPKSRQRSTVSRR
ncbi:Transcription repressor OFP12 [Camellia lanceoleosa]|uniref:Transcription repressor OFP12 n=1 Tax=Camellia lanceoleosa TaxID=1840588 RepID=A0ACC0GRV4_9ERIC|nr:Transcription repressor OFP12 [Camellia lanceoleosa]